MRILVDPEALVRAGIVTEDQARAMRAHTRGALASLGVTTILFAGILAVTAGAIALIDDAVQLIGLGAVVTALGMVLTLKAGPAVRIPANAASVIGTVTAAWGGAILLFENGAMDHALWIGLLVAGAGLALWRAGPDPLRFLARWTITLGAATHVAGLILGWGEDLPHWLVWHYAAFVTFACGLGLDVRLLSGLTLVPLAGALASRQFYGHATYAVAIYEVTLTIVQMALVAVLAAVAASRIGADRERWAGHFRLLTLMCLIWMNMAFWIGALWGDVVGEAIWGPMVTDYRDPDGVIDYSSWRAAYAVWEEGALTIPADLFAAVWAVLLIAAGLWGAVAGRRGIFNMAVTFGAIHFYTQFFERLGASPGAFIAAGLIAIAGAWGTWAMNRSLRAARPAV